MFKKLSSIYHPHKVLFDNIYLLNLVNKIIVPGLDNWAICKSKKASISSLLSGYQYHNSQYNGKNFYQTYNPKRLILLLMIWKVW